MSELYVHFPFCRRKCAYCALLSRVATESIRHSYAKRIVSDLTARPHGEVYSTIYFGGGTPALVPLDEIFDVLKERRCVDTEFTVELHPRDVTEKLLATLHAGGVNRISLGVQAGDDDILRQMGRSHTIEEALAAFRQIRAAGFANAGMDLIAGYPGVTMAMWQKTLDAVLAAEPVHMSTYALIREAGTRLDRALAAGQVTYPGDDAALDQVTLANAAFAKVGLMRYEISNWAKPDCECRHNLAVWRGGDYIGLGEGACGREGYWRTRGTAEGYAREEVSPEEDVRERRMFHLRLREGISAEDALTWHWEGKFNDFRQMGLMACRDDGTWHLTSRGTEVCDGILAELA